MALQIQRFGSFMAAMVVPNIGAFIAWGLITALFIPTGWIPNETFAKLVGPMIVYLLPILIGYTGGKLMYDTHFGVLGGVLVGIVGSFVAGSAILRLSPVREDDEETEDVREVAPQAVPSH